MRKLAHTLLFVMLCLASKAQIYSNEWINYSNKYYKFPIFKEGIYRIDSLSLANSGISLASLNPKNFQLFIKGKEQALYIKGENDNTFNTGDFIEFYANKNDGRFDTALYQNISYLPNPYVSLFSDTIYAFLTWNNSVSNKRFIIDNDTASSSFTPAAYFYSERIYAPGTFYNPVDEYASNASDPRYTQAEGYGAYMAKGNMITTPFTNLNTYTSTPKNAYLNIAFSGASFDYSVPNDHEMKGSILDNSNNPVTLFDTVYFGYKPIRYTYTLQSNNLGNNSNISITSLNNSTINAISNTSALHYVYFKYPQLPDISGASSCKLWVDDNTGSSKSFLKINNVNPGSNDTILFYDLTNNKRLKPVYVGPYAKVLVPDAGAQKFCYMTAESNTIAVNSLTPVNQTGSFVYYKSNADSAFVIVTHNSLMAGANAYKTYRQSVSGGSHAVILADVDDLYDQFAYGIKKHPLAIKNFCHYLIDSLPTKPKNLFLIGKSVQNTELRVVSGAWNKCLVPTIGVPSSDNLFTCKIKTNNSITPEICVGRLAAQNNNDVMIYLNKVIQHEFTLPAEWKKRVLHFGGGTDINQKTQFESYLSGYKKTIEDSLYGGKVYTFLKSTTAPIQITLSDSIKNLFNAGVSLVCFFGHGSLSGFDQAIDDPKVYSNSAKYPLFIANSCLSGNFHTATGNSTSEKFVLIDQKGSIGFLASGTYGFSAYLDAYTNNFYKAIGYTHYNRSVGECIKIACAKAYQSTFGLLQEITALDMSYHGDPAIVISNGRTPDYVINNSSVAFDLKKHIDSIGVSVITLNTGKAINDSIIVKIERFFPTNDSMTIFKKIKAPLFKDTLKFFIPIDFTRGIGLNKFTVFVDAYNGVSELNENNNKTLGTVDLFIQGGDILPVYPYKYNIVPLTPTITLKASTADPFSPSRKYILQLDTTDKFTSPLQTTTLQSTGGVVEWTVNLPFADSTVYYWRASKDSTGPTDGYLWRESSFQTIGNKHGWGQAHFFQFKNDGYQFVKYNKSLRRFDFQNNVTSIDVRTGFLPYVSFDNITFAMNNAIVHTWNCGWNGWTIVVFDSISGKPWKTKPLIGIGPGKGVFGNCVCTDTVSQPLYAFDFGSTNYCSLSTWKPELETFLNSIPVNNYILAYSSQFHGAQSYSNSLYTAFESFGSNNIRTVKDTTSYIIFGRKGMSIGQAKEKIGQNIQSTVYLSDSIRSKWNNGYIASEIIGPSFKWNSLHWKVGTLDSGPGDTTILKVVGIKTNGVRDTLATFRTDSLNIPALYNYANASIYPYLQLVALMKDDVNRTSPQLKRWQVLYDEAPECAINPKKGFKVINDTLQEGDEVSFQIPVENIGTIPFKDSLVFTYWIEDANRINHPLPQKVKAPPFNPKAIIIDTIKINSYQYPGNNALWIDVNPPQNSKYQPEQYHSNNIGRYPFKVNRDITNPLLDVTFDGVRIMNGDIVSAKPVIVISLKDENKFLVLNDTGAFTVYLKKPTDTQEQRIYFANGLIFTPASLPNNSCKIEFNPNLINDGKYNLRVQAKDKSNNISGAVDYTILFEVVNKPSVTSILNYPNPFSTSTRFVFTLTGSEIPETFNIQIMTISGKVVKTIMKDDLGPIHIGRNITTYAWDGKDDFGDKLGNGVYLYKVFTRLNGQSIEKQATAADQYFTKEFGKMVIMR